MKWNKSFWITLYLSFRYSSKLKFKTSFSHLPLLLIESQFCLLLPPLLFSSLLFSSLLCFAQPSLFWVLSYLLFSSLFFFLLLKSSIFFSSLLFSSLLSSSLIWLLFYLALSYLVISQLIFSSPPSSYLFFSPSLPYCWISLPGFCSPSILLREHVRFL